MRLFRFSLPSRTAWAQQRDRDLEDYLDDVAGQLDTAAARLGDGTWELPLTLGGSWLWVDATGDLRISATAPTTDLDGAVVGTQA